MTTDHKRLVAEARMFAEARGDRRDTTIVNRLADALEAACVDRAVVEAQALEHAAEKIAEWRMNVGSSGNRAHDESWDNGNMSAESMLRARAVEIREGRQ